MSTSRRYRELRARIRKLRDHLLPRKFDPTGTYSERQIDRTAAFKLLAHAEIEWYLEEIVVETANWAFDNWRRNNWRRRGLITEPLLAMLTYVDGHLGLPPRIRPSGSDRDLHKRVEIARNRLNSYAKGNNNGIREENVLRLLLSVGISEVDIDQTWLATTNSFGQRRGEIAHSSRQIYSPPNPEDELNTVNLIIDGLSDIDDKLKGFRSP